MKEKVNYVRNAKANDYRALSEYFKIADKGTPYSVNWSEDGDIAYIAYNHETDLLQTLEFTLAGNEPVSYLFHTGNGNLCFKGNTIGADVKSILYGIINEEKEKELSGYFNSFK